jgi:hypothetical protein
MTGRPSIFTQELAALICSRMSGGESLRSICEDADMPAKSSVFRWLADDATFRDQYARAMASRADAMAEEILEIADDGRNDTYKDADGNERTDQDVIARSRLRVDARKWLMARMAPKRYGDKIAQEVSGPNGGAIKTQITEIRLVAVPIPDDIASDPGAPLDDDETGA